MFRFEEDAFLRKGGDFSRNCLSYEAEEAEAEKLALKQQKMQSSLPAFKKNKTVFVSAGGKATESFLQAMLSSNDQIVWSKTSLGEIALNKGNNDDELLGFICPPPVRSPAFSTLDIITQERLTANYLLDGCTPEQNTIVIFATSPYREQADFSPRYVKTSSFTAESCKFKLLEHGRILTSFAAAILEKAQLLRVPAICYLVPREPVLAIETLEEVLKLTKFEPLLQSYHSHLVKSKPTWAQKAIKADEKESRRTEPEGMFM